MRKRNRMDEDSSWETMDFSVERFEAAKHDKKRIKLMFVVCVFLGLIAFTGINGIVLMLVCFEIVLYLLYRIFKFADPKVQKRYAEKKAEREAKETRQKEFDESPLGQAFKGMEKQNEEIRGSIGDLESRTASKSYVSSHYRRK